jgi:hypothetical protein
LSVGAAFGIPGLLASVISSFSKNNLPILTVPHLYGMRKLLTVNEEWVNDSDEQSPVAAMRTEV